MKESDIAWHPAFIDALKMELEAFSDVLEFHSEYQLSSEPLRIDCLIIKKAKEAVIEKNIAAIFREVNLLEYKSPTDYVSVDDFYKVYSYACLYASLEKVPITTLTISFIESHYPERLIQHLRSVREYKVEENSSGIYTVAMSDEAITLDEVIESSGLGARLVAKGRQSEALDIAQNMINLGFPLEAIASATRLDPEKVEALYQQNQ